MRTVGGKRHQLIAREDRRDDRYVRQVRTALVRVVEEHRIAGSKPVDTEGLNRVADRERHRAEVDRQELAVAHELHPRVEDPTRVVVALVEDRRARGLAQRYPHLARGGGEAVANHLDRDRIASCGHARALGLAGEHGRVSRRLPTSGCHRSEPRRRCPAAPARSNRPGVRRRALRSPRRSGPRRASARASRQSRACSKYTDRVGASDTSIAPPWLQSHHISSSGTVPEALDPDIDQLHRHVRERVSVELVVQCVEVLRRGFEACAIDRRQACAATPSSCAWPR